MAARTPTLMQVDAMSTSLVSDRSLFRQAPPKFTTIYPLSGLVIVEEEVRALGMIRRSLS